MQIYALLYALCPMTPKLTTRPLASQQEGARSVYYTASKQRKKKSLQPINFFPRSLLSFAFLGWWLRLDIFRLGSIGCRCSFISFAVLALSGVAVLDVLVNLTFQHFVDVLLGHDFHAPGCRLRQKYFYGRSCHKKNTMNHHQGYIIFILGVVTGKKTKIITKLRLLGFRFGRLDLCDQPVDCENRLVECNIYLPERQNGRRIIAG